MATTADVQQILKEMYGESVAEQVNDETRALSHFERSETATYDWEGKVFVEALHVGRNQSTKAVAEGGLLPLAGKQRYNELRIPDRYVYGQIQVSAQLMSEARGRGAFLNGLDLEVNGMVRDLAVACNRMIWGDGRGVLALMNGAGAGSATITVDSPMGIAGAINGVRFIRPDMRLAFHAAAPANNTPNAVRSVVSINADGVTLVLDAAVSAGEAPDNGVITIGTTRSGTSQGSWQLEPMGLIGMIDDGTFAATIHGLTRANEPTFNANVISNVGNLDEIAIHRVLDMCDEASGAEPDWFTCHHSIHREYIKITLPDKRYSGGDLMRPDAGVQGGGKKHEFSFSGTPIEKERFAPYGRFFGFDSSVCRRYVNEEGKWVDEDGAILHRATDTDEFVATYRKFGNYAAVQNNSSFRLDGINASVDIVNAQ